MNVIEFSEFRWFAINDLRLPSVSSVAQFPSFEQSIDPIDKADITKAFYEARGYVLTGEPTGGFGITRIWPMSKRISVESRL